MPGRFSTVQLSIVKHAIDALNGNGMELFPFGSMEATVIEFLSDAEEAKPLLPQTTNHGKSLLINGESFCFLCLHLCAFTLCLPRQIFWASKAKAEPFLSGQGLFGAFANHLTLMLGHDCEYADSEGVHFWHISADEVDAGIF